ncbi:MAG: LacI family transcriptional regulator [Pseudomonas sp. 34-62-33]|nr:MAG: LacI family transcriptional regulator [Pseudomonas sp. 34-62-33]
MSDIRIQKTGEPDILQTSDGRLTLSVPIQIKRRSGRKLVTLPNGETAPSGEAKSLKEIATREGIDNSYVSRMVNLTTLAPDIVAAILDDALPNHVTLFDLAVDPPALWDEQRARLM